MRIYYYENEDFFQKKLKAGSSEIKKMETGTTELESINSMIPLENQYNPNANREYLQKYCHLIYVDVHSVHSPKIKTNLRNRLYIPFQ